MKKFLILAGGWIITIVGGILTPIPLPLPFPFPIGIMMFLVGCAILTTHSKTFRRGVQYVRHHNAWLSRGLESIAKHTSDIVEKMAHRFTHQREGRFSRGFATIAGRPYRDHEEYGASHEAARPWPSCPDARPQRRRVSIFEPDPWQSRSTAISMRPMARMCR